MNVRRLGVPAALVSALLLVPAGGPRPAHACSPPRPSAQLLAPVGGSAVHPSAVFWFSVLGLASMGVQLDLDILISGPTGAPMPLVASLAAAPSTPSGVSVVRRRFRAEAQLEPNTAYSLTYTSAPPSTVDGEPVRTTYEFTTTAEASALRPENPVVELAFAEADGDAPWPFECSVGEFEQVTIIFVNAPGAAAVHARTRYAGEREFSRAMTHVMEPGATGDTLFAWAGQRGLPCVEVVAEGPDGGLSAPTVVCEAVGCLGGEAWTEGLGESAAWWRDRHGAESCRGVDSATGGGGCACLAAGSERAAGGVVVGGWMVLLLLLGGRRSRWGTVERPSFPGVLVAEREMPR